MPVIVKTERISTYKVGLPSLGRSFSITRGHTCDDKDRFFLDLAQFDADEDREQNRINNKQLSKGDLLAIKGCIEEALNDHHGGLTSVTAARS